MQGALKGKKWIVGSSTHGCWLGSYEFDKQALFEATVRPGTVVFDLGGHVGYYTLMASELVGPSGRVVTFEPVPRNLAYLREHLRMNRVENVTVIEAAVSDVEGTVPFDSGPSSTMGRLTSDGELQVRTVALDLLISRGELPAPDCLKIDIEGAEFLALLGARVTLAREHPTIFLATHGDEVHRRCCDLLRELDYELRPIDGMELHRSSEVLAVYGPATTSASPDTLSSS